MAPNKGVRWTCQDCYDRLYPNGTEESTLGIVAGTRECEECHRHFTVEELRQPRKEG